MISNNKLLNLKYNLKMIKTNQLEKSKFYKNTHSYLYKNCLKQSKKFINHNKLMKGKKVVSLKQQMIWK